MSESLDRSLSAKKVGELANVLSSKRVHQSEYVETGIPFFRSKEVILRSKKKPLENMLYISEDRFNTLKETYGVPVKDDILISAVGTIGKIYLVEDIEFYFKDGNLLWLNNISESITAKFLTIYLSSEEGQRRISNITGGSSQAALTIEKLKELKIEFPPVSQQQKIAKILSTVDNLIEKTQSLIEKYTAIKQGMMADLFTRGIDMTTGDTPNSKGSKLRPSVEDAPELYKQTELGWVPKEWEVDSIRDRIEITYGKSQVEVRDSEGHVPVYGTGGLMEFANTSLFDKDSILIGRKGTLDKPFFIKSPFWVVDTAYYVSDFKDGDIKFLAHLFSRFDFKKLNESTGVPSLNRETIYREKLAFPPVKEQIVISKRINALIMALDENKKYLEKLKKQKKGLMQDLLTGKVRVV